VTTCYDLRFPELYRELVDQGVDLVLVPSAWPYPASSTGRCSRRRAPSKTWRTSRRSTGAASSKTPAWSAARRCTTLGTTLASTDDDPDIVYAEVDPERPASVREEFPALRDRRC